MGWHIQVGGQNQGPLEEADIIGRIRAGVIPNTAQVARDGAPSWEPIATHPAFRMAFASMAGPPPAAPPAAAPPPAAPPVLAPAQPSSAKASGTKKLIAGIGGCAALGVLSLCCITGSYFAFRGPQGPVEIEIESQNVALLPDGQEPEEGYSDEIATVVVITEPEARVRLGFIADAVADEDGRATLVGSLVPTTENSHELEVSARFGEEGDYREGSRTVSLERPARLVFEHRSVTCTSRPCGFSIERGEVTARYNMADTTVVTFGASTWTGQVETPTDSILNAVNPSRLYNSGPYTVDLPIRFVTADGTTFQGTYGFDRSFVGNLVQARLSGVAQGGASVPQEGTGNALLLQGTRMTRLYGTAATLGDIGRVALITTNARRRQCGRYSGGGSSRRLYVRMHDSVVTIYNRRTGAVLDTHTVAAPRMACPRNVQVRPGRGDVYGGSTRANQAAVIAWIARQ